MKKFIKDYIGIDMLIILCVFSVIELVVCIIFN